MRAFYRSCKRNANKIFMTIITLFAVLNSTLCVFGNTKSDRIIKPRQIDTLQLDTLPSKAKVQNVVTIQNIDTTQLQTKNTYSETFNQLVVEVNKYVKNMEISKSLVQNSLQHGIDLIFMMAQTSVETDYGRAGTGRPHKKSLFGVNINYGKKTYDYAINDYCLRVKTKYMCGIKTEKDLMKRYTTPNGAAYCAKSHLGEYSKKMTSTYNKISNGNNKINILYTTLKRQKNDKVY